LNPKKALLFLMFIAPALIAASDLGGINGFVTDAANGEKLGFGNVTVQNTELGAVANDKGYYYLPGLPAGPYRLVFSYIGYEPAIKDIVIIPDQVITVNAELRQTTIDIKGVTATAERTRFEKTVEVSHTTMSSREIKSIPVLFEADLIKSMQLMPGVVPMHDLSNKMYVRGGSPDENLVLLDGIIVYNPTTHLFGLFSTFNPDAVSEADLYAGGFPVKYGDRLSSVLDVTTKEGNSKKYAGEASLGLVTSKALIEGPIPKGSFLFSGRRTYFDALVWSYAHLFNKDINLPYYFYDGVGKINFNPSSENRFTLTGFGGNDVISLSDEFSSATKIDLNWGNRGASLRWRRVFTPKLYGEMIGVWSNFFTHFRYIDYGDSTQNMHFYEEIRSYLVKGDFSYILNPVHALDFGLQAENLLVAERWTVESGNYNRPALKSNLIDGYIQDNWALSPPLLYLMPGLRIMHYFTGNRLRADPRLGLKYHFQPNSSLNLSIGKYSQYLITINNQESFFSIFDFWRPLDKIHEPPYSIHAIAGVEQWIGEGTRLTVETYFKRYFNLLIPKQSDIFFSMPTESLKTGDGYAAGLDLYVKKNWKKCFGWVSYSLGYTRRRIGGEEYFPGFDRRHNLNVVFGITIPRSVPVLKNASLDLRWYLGSGLPYADAIGRYAYYYYDIYSRSWDWHIIKGPRDAYRLPLSHRLDLHLEKNMRLFGLNGSWYLDVMNVYARKNILFYEWEWDYSGSAYPRKVGYSILPIPIPSLGINFRF
jgi:hypothetical protein